MSNVLKKALGLFVDFDETQAVKEGAPGETAPGAEGEGAAAVVTLPDVPADLSQDPDVTRVVEAGKLVASLPLEGIPVEQARELVARTLQFAGVALADLQSSFERARGLYQAAIAQEQARIVERERLHAERMQVLEQAMAEEKGQVEAEVGARTERITKATASLAEMEKSMAFFAEDEEEKAHPEQ
jgi:pyridoxal biosynthesis lyase PdxS